MKKVIMMFFLIGGITITAAQTPSDNKTSPQKPHEQLALDLLEKVIAEIPSLTLEENRLKLWLGAGESLWERDEKRARTLITQAIAEFNALVGQEQSNWATKKDIDDILDRTSPDTLREEVGQALARLDPVLAWDFFTSTQLPPDKLQEYVKRFGDPDQKLEMALIRQATRKNIPFALEKAEKHLAKYGFQNFTNEVRTLAAQDQAAAAALTKAMVASYKKLPKPFDFETVAYMENLLRATLGANDIILGAPGSPGFSIDPKAPRLDEASIREVLEAMGTAALAAVQKDPLAFDATYLFYSGTVFPQLEKYLPSLAQQIKKQTQQNLKNAPPERQKNYTERQNRPVETVEGLLTKAKTASAIDARNYYARAADSAVGSGDFRRARQIIEEHIKEEDRSMEVYGLLVQIEKRELTESIQKNDIATAQRLADRQYSLQEKIKSLADLAENLAQAGERKKAAEIMQDLQQQLGTQVTTQSQLESQFRLARAFAPINPAQGYAVLELTLPRLNDLVGAMATLQGIQQDALFRKGEMSFYETKSPVAQLLAQQLRTLAALAKQDAQRVPSLLEMYQRNEVKNWARLSISQQLLGQ